MGRQGPGPGQTPDSFYGATNGPAESRRSTDSHPVPVRNQKGGSGSDVDALAAEGNKRASGYGGTPVGSAGKNTGGENTVIEPTANSEGRAGYGRTDSVNSIRRDAQMPDVEQANADKFRNV